MHQRICRPCTSVCCHCEQRPVAQQKDGQELRLRPPVPAVRSPLHKPAGVCAQAHVHVLGLLQAGGQQMPHVQVIPPLQAVPSAVATLN